jgi:hypothetical protein
MARPITKNKEEYGVARRNQYLTQRRAVDPKLDRQLKEIEGQSGRRKSLRRHELARTEHLSTSNISSSGRPRKYGGHMPYTKEIERKGFAESEKKKRTAKAYAKSHARGRR